MSGNVYYWSDLHLGHAKVSELRGFATAEDHDTAILNAWAATVTPRDTIWVLGDLTAGGNRATSVALQALAALPGTKRLITGNHDRLHPINRPRASDYPAWLDVFATIDTAARIKLHGTSVVLSHFPYSGDHTGDDRHEQWRLRDLGAPLIHGHVHAEWRTRGKMLNVGVDHWATPVPQQTVLDWLDAITVQDDGASTTDP